MTPTGGGRRRKGTPRKPDAKTTRDAATVAGVTITHSEKVLFPDDGITKRELAEYYEAVSSVMLPHVARRPVTLERYNAGIDRPGIFVKNVVKGFPAWLERVEAPKKDGTVHHPIVTDVRGLVWLAQQNSITPHVWTSRAPEIMHPDVAVFDLDPLDDDVPRLRRAARLLRTLLDELGLASGIKTSGSKGFHIVVPLDGAAEYGQVARWAHGVGEELVRRDPRNLTREFYKDDRGGRILVDTGRNEYSATFAAAYGVRPRPGAPVSMPIDWDELGRATPTRYTVRNVPRRLAKRGDAWKDFRRLRQTLGWPA